MRQILQVASGDRLLTAVQQGQFAGTTRRQRQNEAALGHGSEQIGQALRALADHGRHLGAAVD